MTAERTPPPPDGPPSTTPNVLLMHSRPQSKTGLFWSMSLLALQGLAVVQRELVEKRWLTREEFVEDWAVSQILADRCSKYMGPNIAPWSAHDPREVIDLPHHLADSPPRFGVQESDLRCTEPARPRPTPQLVKTAAYQSPIDALISLVVRLWLCCQIPIQLDAHPVIHLRITVRPQRRAMCRG